MKKISPEYIKRKNGQIVMKALHKLKGTAKLDRIVNYISETENTNGDKIRLQVKKILLHGVQRGFLQKDGTGCYGIAGDNVISNINVHRFQQKNAHCVQSILDIRPKPSKVVSSIIQRRMSIPQCCTERNVVMENVIQKRKRRK